jgi:anaerobic ribonucleoside-triphosphate reductase activating protein
MLLKLAGIVDDSIVDGPGLRLAVFGQGCPHRCPGCHNPQSWDPAGGYERSVEDILAQAAQNPLLSGLTLTGGEPFAQAGAMAELAVGAQARGLNIVTYTGYTWEEILAGPETWQELLRRTDILIDGPFIETERNLDLVFRGSNNQRIIDVPASLATGAVEWRH